jgi:hypothetical protein
MLAIGLVRGSNAYLVWSIAASLLAAIVLVAGSRRARPVPVMAGDEAVSADEAVSTLDEDPPDEPIAQQVSPADAARVARMSNEVQVIDGRPRYHLPSCPHLVGRDSEPLPVHEAIELGFTPCGQCGPDSALLAAAT